MDRKLAYWLYAFIGLHITTWTLAPTLIRRCLPLDAMEGTTWGQQFLWGYDKNPFMSAWLTGIAARLGNHSDWVIYLFSQLSVGICFWAIWQLGKKIVPLTYAFIAVLLLEGIQYYNFHAIDLSDNTLELGFWTLTILFFYQAIHKKNLLNWVLTGLFAALSMMTKYFTIVLFIPMLLFLIVDTNARDNFKKIPLYIGLFVFLLAIAPHTMWLFSHKFITVNYAFDRVSSPPTWQAHFYFPAKFAWQMLEAFMPSALLFVLLFFMGSYSKNKSENIVIPRSDQLFLYLIGLGPLVITILLSAVSGIKLRSGWGQPLLSLSGLMLLISLKPTINIKQCYRFFWFIIAMMLVAVYGYYVALTLALKPSSANYPGREIATSLTQSWHEEYHSPLKYVAGARWLAGTVAYYSADRPTVYIDWNNAISSWIDENKLKETGALFVWDLSEDNNVPYDTIKQRFPNLQDPQQLQFLWLRNRTMNPVKIMIAVLPPESHTQISPLPAK
jgi:4-amino-4-deoxy-L-arabinose transferase-like glycosyltransferase